MNIQLEIIKRLVDLKNCFSNKQHKTELIGEVILVYRINPEIVIYDYYFYVLNLIRSSLTTVNSPCVVLYECSALRALKVFLPNIRISLQIEHTLFKPRIGSSENAVPGRLNILNDSNQYLVRIANLMQLIQSDIIFDYSRINLYNIKSAKTLDHYAYKTFCISPTMHSIDINKHGRSGVITLFGNPNESRRKLFLQDLKNKKISSQNIQGIYHDIDRIYRATKIVINIRQSDEYDTLEELRVLPALRSGAIVICELAPYVKKFGIPSLLFGAH